MAFPNTPQDMVTEIFTGDWQDISSKVYNRQPVNITAGAPNEGGRVQATRLGMSINNRGGEFSTRNPTSPLYGLIGRYTPMRFSVRTVVDTFDRIVSDGWGSTDTGQPWSLFWVGGSAADFDVPGEGLMFVDAAAEYRAAWLADESYLDIELAATVDAGFASLPNVGGGAVEPLNLLVRMQSVNLYYMARLLVTTSEALVLRWYHSDTGVDTQLGTVTLPMTYTGQPLRMRAHVEGHVLRAKVWDVTEPEPVGWDLVVADDRITEPGGIGIRCGVEAGNTNVPVTGFFNDFEARLPLAFIEVAKWPTRWNLAGTDRWSPIVGQGIRRRLGQGKTPLRTAIHRAIVAESPVAFWPLDDGELATGGGNLVDATRPMTFTGGDVEFGAELGAALDSALRIPDDSEAWLSGTIADYNNNTDWTVEYTIKLSGGPVCGQRIITNAANGLQFRVTCVDGNPTSLAYRVVTGGGETQTPIDTESIDLFDGEVHHIKVAAIQNGASVDWTWWIDGVQRGTGSIGSLTLGGVTEFQTTINVPGVEQTIAAVAVYADATVGTHYDAAVGYPGETAADRIERLCGEQGVPIAIVGDASTSQTMGAQTRQTFLALLDECESADLGRLWEPRGANGFVYRCRSSYYNQPSTLNLSYGQLTPFEPVEDDQTITNDITVTRTRGASVQKVKTTGRLSIQDPPDGIGTVDTEDRINIESDDDLAQQAGWRLHRGTWDEDRNPSIRLHLAGIGRTDPALMYRAASRSIRDRLTIDGLPEWLPPGDLVQVAEGWSMVLSLTDWELFLNCVPYGPYEVFEVEATGNRGRVDTGGSELDATAGEADPTIDVTTTAGPEWRTTAGGADTPFDIEIDGERITVTAIAGSAPQTFTVTRSVNGVVKEHAAGTPVSLWLPARVGL